MLQARTDLEKMKRPDATKRDPADICWMAMRRTEFKCRSDPEFSVHSFINTNKTCLADPCFDRFPAADSMYYRPTDKLNREYQRTWKECILKTPKRKLVCTQRPVEFKRRPRKTMTVGNCTPSEKGSRSLGLAACKKEMKSSCPKFKLPFCKPARSGKCDAGRSLLPCIRRRTKYPSYSECDKAEIPHMPPVECFCIRPQPSMCAVWNHFRMKKS